MVNSHGHFGFLFMLNQAVVPNLVAVWPFKTKGQTDVTPWRIAYVNTLWAVPPKIDFHFSADQIVSFECPKRSDNPYLD